MRQGVLIGDCVEQLAVVPDKTFHTCVTSPPYYGLRDYEVDGQIGQEQTPAEFITSLVAVFREVRRVLRDDGTLWVNMGDSYAGSGKGQWSGGCRDDKNRKTRGMKLDTQKPGDIGFKRKDLMGIPWRLAIALQDDGWYLRQDIIWHKPNALPESVRDRCTKAHEYVFLLSKRPKYYYDHEAVKEPVAESTKARMAQEVSAQKGSNRVPGKTNGAMKAVGDGETRNKRTVWSVPTASFKGAHCAVFPPALIEPCILAGAPVGGWVLDPFLGSGTTAVVAEANGRKWIGCELNPEYAKAAEERVAAARPSIEDLIG